MANLITLDEFKEAQGLSSSKDDDRYEFLITSVSQLVKTYCGNSIVDYYTVNKVEVLSVFWDTHILHLTESPVNSLVSVEERSSIDVPYTTLSSTDYFLDETTDSLVRVAGSSTLNWKLGPGSVKVTYTAGYSSCPEDLKLAVIDLVNYYHKDEYKARQTLAGASRENAPSGDTKGFPDHIKRVLDLYKNF